jgi:hypothetical protein
VKAAEVVRRVVRRILRRDDMVADWSGGIGRKNDRTVKTEGAKNDLMRMLVQVRTIQ